MKALCWLGKYEIGLRYVADPRVLNPHDAIIRVSSASICGSDLHIYDGCIPTMQKGDILGHESMGEVVDVGAEVKNLAKGDWVVVPFAIACGQCFFCRRDMHSL